MSTVTYGAPRVPVPGRDIQVRELAVFLLLLLRPALFAPIPHADHRVGFVRVALATMSSELALVALVVYFLWRNAEPADRLGWTGRRLGRNIALGIALFVPVSVGATALARVLQQLGVPGPPSSRPFALVPSTAPEIALAVVLVVVVAVAEEVLFRGYLLLRLRAVTRWTWVAVVLSSLIFTLGHRYEGLTGMAAVAVVGLANAAIYLRTQSLVAPIALHFLQDFVSVVLGPLSGSAR